MRIALVCAGMLAAVSLPATAQDAARDLAASCAVCHGTNGRSAGGNEPLAGMAKADLVRKFNEFRFGAQPATIMHQISKGYTDQQIELIADHFSRQTPAR